MATNKYIIKLIIDTGSGEARVKGVAEAFEQLDRKAEKAQVSINKASKSTKNLGGAAGLAGSTVLELGRLISDLPYGVQAVSNNISQLGSNFGQLVGKGGGLVGALSLVRNTLMSPLGLVLGFQAAVAAVDFFSRSLDRNQKEVEKEKEKLKELNDELDKQIDLMNTQASLAFDYSEDVTKALGSNVKEVSRFLKELAKEGPVTREQFEGAIEIGNKLLEARKLINIEEDKMSKIKERLNELGGEQILTDEQLEEVTLKNWKAQGMWNNAIGTGLSYETVKKNIEKERSKLIGDLNHATLKLNDANVEAGNQLQLLNYQATEAVEVEGKLKEAKEETNTTYRERIRLLNAEIKGVMRTIIDARSEVENKQLFDFLANEDDQTARDKYLTFLKSMSDSEAHSFEERARYLSRYNSLKERYSNEEIQIETAKQRAIAQQKMSELDIASTVFNALGEVAGESRVLQALALVGEAAAGISKVTISTAAANAALTAQGALNPALLPYVTAQKAANNIAAKASKIQIAASTAVALSKLKAPVSAPSTEGGGTDGGTATPASPIFNVVGGSAQTQIASAIAMTQGKPIKAYVVSSDVTTAQEFDRKVIEGASI